MFKGSPRTAALSLVVAVVFAALTSPLAKTVRWGLPFHLLVRSAIACLTAFLLVRSLPKWSELTNNELAAIVFCGLTSPLFVISAALGSPNVANVLVYSAPMWAALYSYFIQKHDVDKFFWYRLALTLGGLIEIVSGSILNIGWLSILFGLSGGISFGLWSVFHGQRPENRPNTDIVGGLALGAIFFGVLSYRYGLPPNLFDIGSIKSVVAAGVLVGAVYWLIAIASKSLPEAQALLIFTLEVPSAFGWDWWILGEKPDKGQIIGAVLIIIGVTWQAFASSKKKSLQH